MKVKITGIVTFLGIKSVQINELCELVKEYQQTGSFSDREQADAIAKELSDKLLLEHTAEEWMNALIGFAKL